MHAILGPHSNNWFVRGLRVTFSACNFLPIAVQLHCPQIITSMFPSPPRRVHKNNSSVIMILNSRAVFFIEMNLFFYSFLLLIFILSAFSWLMVPFARFTTVPFCSCLPFDTVPFDLTVDDDSPAKILFLL